MPSISKKITVFYLLIMYILAFFSKAWLVDLAFIILSIVEILTII